MGGIGEMVERNNPMSRINESRETQGENETYDKHHNSTRTVNINDINAEL